MKEKVPISFVVCEGDGECSSDSDDEKDDVMFKYHNTNACFKNYVHKKSIDAAKRKKANDCPEPMEVDIPVKTESPAVSESRSTRSSLSSREPPSCNLNPVAMKCTICTQKSKNKVYEKYRICEEDRALRLAKAALFFKDGLFTRIADLISDSDSQTVSAIRSADLYCHKSCYDGYVNDHQSKSKSSTKPPKVNLKRAIFKRAYPKLVQMIKSKGIYTMSDLLEFTLNYLGEGEELDSEFKKRDLKLMMFEEFGDSITITENPRKNESDIVYSSDISPAELAVKLKNLNVYHECGQNLRKILMNVDFGLNNSFCDADDLEEALEKNNYAK